MSLKIVLCANTSWYLYNFRRNLIAAIQQAGHDVYAISPHDAHVPKLQALHVTWHHLPLHQTSTHPFTELWAFLRLGLLLKTLQPDVALTFTIKCNLYTGLWGRLFNFRQIANISGLGEVFETQRFLRRFVCRFYRIALRKAHKVFFQNQEDLQTFLAQKILPEALCERLPGSGVDLSRFTPVPPNIGRAQRIFLMFGRIVPRKGYDLFVQAARQVKANAEGRAEFWILGIEDRSRPESQELFQRIVQAHADGLITYLPQTDEVAPIVQQADVVVLPSTYHEGVPRCLLEALACGKPIITTDWKGCRDTVKHGVNGLLMEPGDWASLITYIEFFLRADWKTLYQMGCASRQKAECEFDERPIIEKYLAELR